MKRNNSCIVLVATALCLMYIPTQAQEKTDKQTLRIDLTYHQKNDELPVLKVSVKTKNGKRFEPVEGIETNFFFQEESAEGFMGRIKTNNHGMGSLQMPAKFKTNWDSLPTALFIATVTSNKMFEDESVEIEITKARIELTLEEEDSIRTIYAKVLAFQDSSWAEVPDTDIKFVVKRLLNDLSAGEEELYTTDEAGEVSAEYALIIPGDDEGNIFIGAKIEDHELYGNMLTTKMVDWGVPLNVDKNFEKRTLFATRDKTPIWLLVFPNLIIASVWLTIFFLFYQIAQIRKIGKAK